MIKELDASEIIAFCLKENHALDTFEIQYKTIRAIAKKIEEKIPTLLVTADMMSIDAFRCEFSANVIMSENGVRINHVKKVYSHIQRYLPDDKLELQLRVVEAELNVI